MAQAVPGALKKTPLNARHRSLGARMVEFGGWDMPVEYSGVVDEHMAVRSRAGLFDVSHMGEIEIAGRDALEAVQHITSNDASRLSQHQAQYSALTTPDGTFVDDVLTYKLAEEHFMLVVNASNIIKDFTWIAGQIDGLGDVVAVNTSSRYALIAIQGPAARDILQTLTGVNLSEIKYYWFTTGEVASRGGNDFAHRLYRRGRLRSVRAAGAGRARLGRDSGRRPRRRVGSRRPRRARHAAARGGDAPVRQRHRRNDDGARSGSRLDRRLEEGRRSSARRCCAGRRRRASPRKLVGFEVLDRGIARHGHEVFVNGERAGVVTSGTQTPFLKKAIGMAYLPAASAGAGDRVRDRRARPPRCARRSCRCRSTSARGSESRSAVGGSAVAVGSPKLVVGST